MNSQLDTRMSAAPLSRTSRCGVLAVTQVSLAVPFPTPRPAPQKVTTGQTRPRTKSEKLLVPGADWWTGPA